MYGLALFGTAFTAVVTFMMATHWRGATVAGVLIVPPFLGTWLTIAWRLARTGLVVSDAGVRIRWVHRTRTFTWDWVLRFYTAPDILVPGRLWIELTDGTRVRTPIQRVRYVLLGSALRDGGTWLTPDRYDALLQDLGNRLDAARSA